ncbi:signal recognition particle-docking protein FtsY [Anabaena sp. FACHB-1250]|uniref:Signal recognition particle receptor FtsY n=1 Tax=Dolichospermum planctonicum TaxID=136072 RepID=A0A480AGZ3_9CYAN|nr:MULTISPECIES: signal recognition particle-docking protein FtsY [Nostocales]MBD2140467.1 signal recognition particle-docking protein FtsY [Anabaena sp. FACHB-1250]MBD2269151.1 signal recognition particle-docking protein FtsY [Anabaena sp. FACHB-1391]GCL43346.1 signal recognition particle-docking protein FtsY [Dolichospermum planctonicum]
MAFNWFNRPHHQSADTPQTQTEPPAVAATQSETTVPDTEDLLAFAKAAYKNIQEKQQIETVTPVTVAEDTIPEKIVATEEVITLTENAVETTEDIVNELQPEAANLSFLERAAAERQAKQEKLIASSIETEIPEILTITTETEVTIPELAFDDGFRWSAEVLAAQGRKAEDISIEEITWLKKLRQGLDKTRRNIINRLKSIVGQGPLNQDAVNEIESLLLQADVGVEATEYIITALQKKLLTEVTPPEQAIAYLKEILRDMLDAPLQNHVKSRFAPEKDTLTIWLITGVNGAGKTTTIGKISHLAQKSGYKCLIGAADTFRAAAVEQVKVWGNRSGVEVIANPGKNTDPAAVVFDAITAAQARETELLLIDTAGRLQNKKNLMEELSKIRKIITKKAPNTHVESLLVLDATLGQNGLRQAEVFSQAAQLSGVVLTKLDGTARGGVALAVVQQLGLPIRFIGAGEGIEDLRPFSSYEFVEALLSG